MMRRKQERKTMWDLIPFAEVRDVAELLTLGATTHPAYGWQEVSIQEHFAAAMRHLSAWASGEIKDNTGFSHLACACARVLFCMWHEKKLNKE